MPCGLYTLLDIVVKSALAHPCSHTYSMVKDRNEIIDREICVIAMYLLIQFITEVAGSCPILFINRRVTSVLAASGQLPPVL